MADSLCANCGHPFTGDVCPLCGPQKARIPVADSLVDRLRATAGWGLPIPLVPNLLREAATHIETIESQLEAINKVIGTPYGHEGMPLVERVILRRKQMDEDDARCELWRAELVKVRQELGSQKGRNKALERRIRKELEPTLEKLYAELAKVRQRENQLHAMPYEDE